MTTADLPTVPAGPTPGARPASKGLRVTVDDLDAGGGSARVIAEGDYLLITSAPCYRAGVQAYPESGTHVVTIKGYRPAASPRQVELGAVTPDALAEAEASGYARAVAELRGVVTRTGSPAACWAADYLAAQNGSGSSRRAQDDVPLPPDEWLREHTGPGSKGSAGYGWQAGWRAGYAEAVARLRDDERYRDWWTADGAGPPEPTGRYWSAEARGHLADYLEAINRPLPTSAERTPTR